MARTSLAGRLGEAAAVAREAALREAPVGEVLGERSGLRRRELIAGGAGLAAAAMLGGRIPRALAASAPRIAVVGGGLAGLTCAYRLKQAGYRSTLYEASDRLGGRCWTRRGDFAEGQIAEHGGELIDQGHTEVRKLAQELGLDLDNLLSAEVNGNDPFYYFDGQPYSFTQATEDLKQIWQQIHKDVSAASYPTLYTQSTQRGRELDAMSIAEWIEANVPGGTASKLGQLLDVAYNIEYGAETNVQSSLNMLYLLGYSGQGQLRIFGPSNEKYHVRGGNDRIASGLATALQGQIVTGSELAAIRRNADASYRLTLRSGSGSSTVTADQVVLALPFSILRDIDFSKAGFSPIKETAIRELGMGTNSKLHVQFSSRYWNTLGNQGETYADTGYQNTWEVTRAQPGAAGILVDYTGGTIGASFGSGTPAERAKRFLTQIEPVLPGISSRWNGRATIDFWTGYPWTKGSYSYWKVGQYTKFAGAERQPEDNCHFAGEHTSIDFQGYLNGAVESGERAAGEILAALK
ncbi:MAG TPA: NAD(P)/FAD-dependent oxidoreductase [Solirubrobacterales bacterium]|jgi:monoamine oxidase|nr:NAD(P)/FAD-dependent oxidoreductase [Solirubrobacterales bacterium]